MSILKWLGAGAEDKTPRHGFLSARSEWHSLFFGLIMGFVTALIGGKDAAWMFTIFVTFAIGTREINAGQLKHVKKEPLYALAASIITFLISVFIIVPAIPEVGLWYNGIKP